jgi:hypothetical protein
MRSAAIIATALVGSTYFFAGTAIAGAGDIKKEEVVKPGIVHAIVMEKAVKVEPVVKEVMVEPKATSNNRVFVRNVNNPFFFRRVNPFFARPFFADEDAFFFGD